MRLFVLACAFFLPTASGLAADVEIAPFIGFQYGGALECCASERRVAIDVGLQYGGTVDVGWGSRFGLELLFARQETELASTPRMNLGVERYLAGIREEKDLGRLRFFGVFLIGMTRVVPSGFDADERFTLAAGLGLRTPLSRHFGVRADVRAYYAVVTAGGAFACGNGGCLIAYSGSGVWQGDVTAALVWTP